LRVLLGATLAAGAGPAHARDIRWTTPVAFPSALPALGAPADYLAERLERMSDGEVRLLLQEPDNGTTAVDILQAVDEGRADAGYTRIGFNREATPAAALFDAVPFGLKPWAFMAWYYQGPGHDMLQDVYANQGFDIHARLCGLAGPESAGWYEGAIDSTEDFQGLRIRFGGLGGEVLKRLGATLSAMPPKELAGAVESGDVDATGFSLPIVDQHAGLDSLFSHNLYPGWHQSFTAQYLLINGKQWRRAGRAQQTMIETACAAATTRSLAESEYTQGKAVANLEQDGVKIRRLPPAVLTSFAP
jgi:TRAP-type mannitol/chloroaromatic compound transport system substrate-binding protein